MPRTDFATPGSGADAVTSRRNAPAKINLALHVVGRRADGYHLIESLVVFAGLADRIVVKDASEDHFAVAGDFAADVPLDGRNLVLRACEALRAAFPRSAMRPVSIALEKTLPVASGIGGGSSDAAATLKALADHWALDAGDALSGLGLGIGADLPMCLSARPLVARGIGDRIEALAGFPGLPLVLVNPGAAVPTARVFAGLERRDNPGLPPFPAHWSADTLIPFLHEARNDLEAPALAIDPAIGEALAALRGRGAALARMSGSGATSFGIFGSLAEAKNAAEAIAGRHPRWWVRATTTGASEDRRDEG